MPIEGADVAMAQVVVTPSQGVITGIAAARDGLNFARREGATLSLWRLPHAKEAKAESIALPFEGNVNIQSIDAQIDGAVLDLARLDSHGQAVLLPASEPVRDCIAVYRRRNFRCSDRHHGQASHGQKP